LVTLRQLKELLTIELADKLGEQSLRISMRSICKRQEDISLRATKEFSLRQRHASISTSLPPAPAIDFNKEITVEVFIGEKSIGGSDIEIVHAERIDGTLLISFVEKIPRRGGIATQAIYSTLSDKCQSQFNGAGAVGFRRMS
jgi:hypothetical protein